MSATGKWSRKDLPGQDCCTGAAHSLQSTQQFSLPFDCRILRIGCIAFLLDNAKLVLDQFKPLVFPFKLATQAFAEWPALSSGQLAEVNSRAPPLRFDSSDALGEQQTFDAVDMASALSNQALALAMRTASVFLFDRGYSNDGAYVALATVDGDEASQ